MCLGLDFKSHGTYRRYAASTFLSDARSAVGATDRAADGNPPRVRKPCTQPAAGTATARPRSQNCLLTLPSTDSLRCRVFHIVERLQTKSTANLSSRVRPRAFHC